MSRSLMALGALVALVGFGSGCSSTWQGLRRDAGALFGGDEVSIKEAQQLLNERGYDAGPADGMPGRRTTRAVRAYQADNALPVTGTLDDELLTHLRESPAVRRVQAEPSPPPTAEDAWVDPY